MRPSGRILSPAPERTVPPMPRKDTLPAMLLGRAAALGAPGTRWLDGLDALVAELEMRWRIRVSAAMQGGSHAFAVPAIRDDGSRCVLKIELPDEDESVFLQGLEALRAADGRGYARVYDSDAAARAVLLEQLGPTLRSLNWPIRRQMEVLCDVLQETWAIPAGNAKLPDGAASVNWFRGFISEAWTALEQPCPRRVIDRAMAFLDGREARRGAAERVLLHGDAHNNNLLQTLDGSGFRFIDPDGILYEPAYDLGVLMREWPEEYAAAPLEAGLARCEFLHRRTGVDAEGIWAWGYLQTVSTSLVLLQIGQAALARRMLAVAEAWAER